MNETLAFLSYILNIPQARAMIVMAVEMWCVWGRGTGKTEGVIAPWILHKVINMPRSNGGLIGKTYTDLETKILQPLFLAFQKLGYEKDIHYVYGKKPPEGWEKPLTPIIDFKYVLTFQNGTTIELISLHLKGSANGKSLQWIVVDETKFLDEDQLRAEVFPILRGHLKYFGESPWYGAKLFVTDKLSPNINWILEKRKLHNEQLVNVIIYYQLKVNELTLQLQDVSDSQAYKIRAKIKEINDVLCKLRKKCVYYSEAKSRDNIVNLGADYFINMQRSLTAYEYAIAIENEDPTKVENGFYNNRTSDNLYSHDDDEDIYRPLAVTFDYQGSLSPLAVAQVNDKVIPGVQSLNFIDALYTKPPLGLDEVIDRFCTARLDRPCKVVYYFYDHTAVGDNANHKKLYEQVISRFKYHKWKVVPFYMKAAPSHNLKYRRINDFFKDIDMPIMIHSVRCAAMVISMDMTAAKNGSKGVEKDKSLEKNKNFPQEQATHFSDTFDMMVWAVKELNLYPTSLGVHADVGVR